MSRKRTLQDGSPTTEAGHRSGRAAVPPVSVVRLTALLPDQQRRDRSSGFASSATDSRSKIVVASLDGHPAVWLTHVRRRAPIATTVRTVHDRVRHATSLCFGADASNGRFTMEAGP